MKKVRFETPSKTSGYHFNRMDESECHSPRPFIERQTPSYLPAVYQGQQVVYSCDPVQRYEYSDSSPYPLVRKTVLPTPCDTRPNYHPSNELNLSMLDIHDPRPPFRPIFTEKRSENTPSEMKERTILQPKTLTSIDTNVSPPNVLSKEDSFFIRRENLDKYFVDTNTMHNQLSRLYLDKENNPLTKKAEILRTGNQNISPRVNNPQQIVVPSNVVNTDCNCHHCNKVQNAIPCIASQPVRIGNHCLLNQVKPVSAAVAPPCHCHTHLNCPHCEEHFQKTHKSCNCSPSITSPSTPTDSPRNAVDKKTWAIEKYEQSKNNDCLEVEKQTNVTKEKREPTISDLLKIIKLQNEQLQLLQEKVDKFVCAGNQQRLQSVPVQNYMTEHVALQTVDSEHKISIGVMTSFEMVRTSTVINKEILKQTNDNAKIQCNMSQISIKEVVSKQPVNLNFLDGIMPVDRNPQPDLEVTNESVNVNELLYRNATMPQTENMNDEKTLNELSLYNVQVDNATTPLMSPEQSLYLDVRDYSDSDSSSDHSNVGWTYYNKVMTHVNGMLQDSDMPSSASALYRNTRQQCLQMQIDKTNVSVTKRVKFPDDPLGFQKPHIYTTTTTTDTSLKMDQLAAKYLKTAPLSRALKAPTMPTDMSFATRNYMEKHKLIQGLPSSSRRPNEMPKFLDITALKQQPKLL